MTDTQFLNWIADRIVNRYSESPDVDFVVKLRAVAASLDTPSVAEPMSADTSLNFRTRIHLAPNGEVQYVHLEKDGQVIGLTIEQATSLAKEITSRLGLTRP